MVMDMRESTKALEEKDKEHAWCVDRTSEPSDGKAVVLLNRPASVRPNANIVLISFCEVQRHLCV